MEREELIDRLEAVKNTILESAGEREVTLIAVSKFVDPSVMQYAYDCGVREFGENYPQHLVEKYDSFPGVHWHMIGQLQANKVKYLIGKTRLIQSLDRISLAEEIQKRASASGIVQKVLVQVNIGREPQKGGVLPEKLEQLLSEVVSMPNIRVEGLMAIPPADDRPSKWFTQMYDLFDRFKKADERMILNTLSMGMSHDYAEAIRCGANMVRVGTAIFGPRSTSKQEI